MQEKSNPVFSSILDSETYSMDRSVSLSTASFLGISFKTIFLLILSIVSGIGAVYILGAYSLFALPFTAIIGLIAVIVGTRKPDLAMPMSIIYALCQGVFLVLITLLAEMAYPGIAITAVLVTASIFSGMLILFTIGVIRGGSRVRRFVISALVGWMLVYIVTFVMALFGNDYLMNLMFGMDSLLALGITAFMVVVGALMLTVHFADASRIVEGAYEKKYEWSASLGLLVGIIYLYYQVLRILIMLAGRRR